MLVGHWTWNEDVLLKGQRKTRVGDKRLKERDEWREEKTCPGRLECTLPAWGKVESSGLKLQWDCISVRFFLIWDYTYILLIMSEFTVSMLWCDFNTRQVSFSNFLDYFHSGCEITPESCFYFTTLMLSLAYDKPVWGLTWSWDKCLKYLKSSVFIVIIRISK